MEFERMSMARLEDIQRLLKQGRSVREISRVLQCRKQTVIDVKKNLLTPEHLQAVQQIHSVKVPPTWTMELDWQLIEKEVRKGFELKRIWEDYAANVTSNSNFFKYVRKRFRQLLQQTVTLREFNPGEYAEVDYAGNIIEQRSYGKSTLFTTQLPIDHWGEIIGDAIILDALSDRLETPGIVIRMTEESCRKNIRKNKSVETLNQ